MSTFKHPYQDPQSERLLLVVLEDKQYPSSEYRHIRATVIRRAVPHSHPYEGGGFQYYSDDHPDRCSGYRVASYVFSGRTTIYVDDMQLRGQIDETPQPLRDGRPYGNNIRFTPYMVDWNTARAIEDFYKKHDKFIDKYNLTRQDDDFYVALNHLAQFLKITKIVFFKNGVKHAALSETNCFEEVDVAFAKVRIDAMLAPFLRTPSA